MLETIRHQTFDFISIIHLVYNDEALAELPPENANETLDAEASAETCTDTTLFTEAIEPTLEEIWYYSIGGITGRNGFSTQEQATHAAEEDLFGEFRHCADEYLRQAIAANKFEIALALAERRGFHDGQAYAHRQAAKSIKEAWTTLEPLSRY